MMNYHRAVIFRPRYRQIGMFSLPYQLIFEALAPIIEFFGYVALLLTLIAGVLSLTALLQFLALAMAINLSLSTLSVLLCVYSEQGAPGRVDRIALFPYARMRDVVVLLIAGFVSNIGYRQYLVAWQLKGLIDFFKGKKGWDKFARKGFAPAT